VSGLREAGEELRDFSQLIYSSELYVNIRQLKVYI